MRASAIRSCWMRSIITASASRNASGRVRATSQPSFSTPAGISVLGPATRTRAPSFERQWTFDRATRLCAMSPTIEITLPSSGPSFSRSVRASSKAWVGCSCDPSPALTTLARTARATARGAPAAGWRTVSCRDSPLVTLEASFWKLSTAAPSACAATSKELRVRVEASKKSVTTMRPGRISCLGARAFPARAAARSRLKRPASPSTSSICSRRSDSMSRRWRGNSDAMEQPPREVVREARLEDLPRRLLGVVGHAPELDHLVRVVPDAVAGARVVVARLPAAPDAAQVLVAVLDAQPLLEDVLHQGQELEGALQVRVADEGEVWQIARRAQYKIFGLLQRKDVLEGGRVPRAGVPPQDLPLLLAVGERPQPGHVLGREVQRGPVQHLARGGVVVAVIHAPGDRRIVVPQHAELAAGPDEVAGLVRVRPVTDRISETNEAVDALALRGGDARRQSLEVCVHVGEDGGPHRAGALSTPEGVRLQGCLRDGRMERFVVGQLAEGLEPGAHLGQGQVAQPVEGEGLDGERGDGATHHHGLAQRRQVGGPGAVEQPEEAAGEAVPGAGGVDHVRQRVGRREERLVPGDEQRSVLSALDADGARAHPLDGGGRLDHVRLAGEL